MKDIGKYKVFNTIGTGGMANIYLAEKKDTGEKVAIKEIIPQVAKDEEYIKRFVREVKIMQSLSHPNILPIYDACLGPEEYYIVMPYLSGGTLKELISRVQKIPMDFSIFILQQIMKALEYAHHKGVIHRDLKPSNVMFSGDGNLYLTDFGVARASTLTQLTQTGEILGTPGYMSPEQVLGMPIDYRSDYFSFGIMAYELLTGINPFLTDNPITTMKQIVEYYPPGPMDINPSIPPFIEDIILKLLKKKPEERISSGFEILEYLLSYWNERQPAGVKENFIEFLKNPEETLKKFQEKEAKEHKEKAKILLEKKESKTIVFWHIFQAHNLNPQDSEAKKLFEDLKASLGEIKSAKDPVVERLEEKWRQNPENFNVLIQLGKIYRSRKDYLNLLKIYNRLERLNIKDPYLKGQIQSLLLPEEQKPSAPLQEFKKESFNPLKAIPLWLYIIVGILLGIFFINRVITKGQEKAQETTQRVSEEMDNIMSGFEQNIKKLDFDIKPYIKMEKEGNFRGALEGYNALISEKPNHPEVYKLQGRAGLCALKISDYAQAVENLKAAYTKSPSEEKKKYLLPLSEAYTKNGQNFEAESILKEGIEMQDEEISPLCLLRRAELYLKQGKRNAAKDDFETLEREYPHSPVIEEAGKLKISYGIE